MSASGNLSPVGVDLSALCALGMQAELLTGVFRSLLINLFLSPEYIKRPTLRSRLWQKDTATNILIESITRWEPELTQARPAVIVKENSYRNYRIGIGDFSGTNDQGDEHFSTFWVGSHTLFCLRDESAVKLLAAEVRDYLVEFGPQLRKRLNLHMYQVQQVGAMFKVQTKSKEVTYGIPITVGWAYEHNWTLETESLPLRKVSLKIMTEL